MIIKLADQIQINYEVYGSGPRLVLLHGWDNDLHTFDKVISPLSSDFQVIAPDLPGFGYSPPVTRPLGTTDFAEIVEKFLETLGVDACFLLGHSFGGAIALRLTVRSKRVKALILEDSSGVRLKSLTVRLKISIFKLAKKVLPTGVCLDGLRKLFGSDDYRKAGKLGPTFVKVVNEDLRDLLPQIGVPTLLIWGSHDKETPLAEARIINRSLPGSKMAVIKDGGHFPHRESPEEFARIVADFLKAR